VHTPAWQVSPVLQAVPHVPQFAGSLFVFTHVPLQSVWVPAHLQAPPVQVKPLVGSHFTSQSPQLLLSLPGSMQDVPQIFLGSKQSVLPTHFPLLQTSVALQAVPQAPQLLASLLMFTHVPLQSVVPVAQPHFPAVQVWPVAHLVLQAPQLSLLLWRSTQAPLQVFLGDAQVVTVSSPQPARAATNSKAVAAVKVVQTRFQLMLNLLF
jgi:hypothetical protein